MARGLLLLSFLFLGCAHPPKTAPGSPAKTSTTGAAKPARTVAQTAAGKGAELIETALSQSPLFLEKQKIGKLPFAQRMGYQLEAKDTTFKGCVLYLPGLGDSIRNHDFYFGALNRAGYRVLMFDYLGQGGSDGDMAKTRIVAGGDPFVTERDFEIDQQAKFVWKRYSETPDPVYGRDCSKSPIRVIGWSTGGLAAYRMASEKWAQAVILIAPGLAPNPCVGEIAGPSIPRCLLKSLQVDQIITLRTLTSNRYPDGKDPHFDPIKPNSPFMVKEFATNLLSTAYRQAPGWKVDPAIKGLVFLGGEHDTYVDAVKSQTLLKKNARHFELIRYSEGYHELHNEVPAIADDLTAKTIAFLDRN